MPSIAVLLQVVAITNATVIDPSTGVARADRTIIVQGTRIATVGAAAQTVLPPGATIVDGRGKYVIPGLWDMHVHDDMPGGEHFLPLYVAHGVTGVRDMNGRLDVLRAWQRDIARGVRVGPRQVISGPYLNGGPVPIPSISVRTPEQGIAGVDSLRTLGVDFLKVHNGIPAATYFAIARRARERGIVFAGHVFGDVTPVEASDSGQRSLEHLSGFPNQCSAADSARVAALPPVLPLLLGTCTSAPQAPGYARLARNGTWVDPTLVVLAPIAEFRPSAVAGDRLSRFFTDSMMAFLPELTPPPTTPTPEERALASSLFARRVAMVGALSRAGVPLLTGSDVPAAPALPGEGVHDELSLFVRAGLSPLAALRAATWEPARYLAATDSLGTVAPGKVADLVILDANPLAAIENVRRIHAVVANGRFFDTRALAALIAGARRR